MTRKELLKRMPPFRLYGEQAGNGWLLDSLIGLGLVYGLEPEPKPVAWRRRRKGIIGDDGWIMCPVYPGVDAEFDLQPLYLLPSETPDVDFYDKFSHVCPYCKEVTSTSPRLPETDCGAPAGRCGGQP